MFEKLIAYHCAPALAGIKSANIVACYKKQFKNITDEVNRLNSELNKRDIYFEILCECEKRALVMAYRCNKLEQYLTDNAVAGFLKSIGYPAEFSVKAYIAYLKERLKENDFPHEIGAFLGYPLSDIYGFINREKCILVGDWKVYSNAETAKQRFHRYNACKCAVLKRITEGRTLAQLFGA